MLDLLKAGRFKIQFLQGSGGSTCLRSEGRQVPPIGTKAWQKARLSFYHGVTLLRLCHQFNNEKLHLCRDIQ